MLFKTALLSAMAVLASAYTQPDYNKPPSGNAITKPGLHDLVTAGKPYTIEWEPTTKGPISLVLLRGPSNNVQPIDTLADSIENSGHFDWTPSADLKPDTTHYGLLLVVEGSGQYQYSTQFGVKNEESPVGASSTSAVSSAPAVSQTPVARDDDKSPHTSYSTEDFVTTKCPKCSAEASAASSSSSSATATATPAAPSTTLTSIPVVASSSSSASAVAAASSSATVIPSSAAAGPSSASASASAAASSSAPSSSFTGAADRNVVGLGAVAAGVLAALVV